MDRTVTEDDEAGRAFEATVGGGAVHWNRWAAWIADHIRAAAAQPGRVRDDEVEGWARGDLNAELERLLPGASTSSLRHALSDDFLLCELVLALRARVAAPTGLDRSQAPAPRAVVALTARAFELREMAPASWHGWGPWVSAQVEAAAPLLTVGLDPTAYVKAMGRAELLIELELLRPGSTSSGLRPSLSDDALLGALVAALRTLDHVALQ